MKRSTLLGSIGAGAAALTLPRPAYADDIVRIGAMPIDSSMESTYASKIGYADQAHLNLAIQGVSSGAAIMAAILGRAIDSGNVNMFSVLNAHDRGLPVVIIASAALYSSKYPTAALLVRKDSAIKDAVDMNGKTIAVDGLKSTSQFSAMAWVDKNGGDSKTLRFVEMPVPDMQLALATKRVDVGSMPQPFASRATKTDARIICNVYDGIANAWLQNAWVASADWVSANPDVARRFRALVYKTAGWANQHQTESADMLAQVSKVELDVIKQTPRARYAEKDNIELLDPVIDVSVKYGLISKRPTARDLFAPELRA